MADFRKTKAGIKLHTQIDLRGPIPTCICITGARQHDVGWLDSLLFKAGAFYLKDRGYMDLSRLILIANAGAFFVTRAKSNLQFTQHYYGTSPNAVKTQIWIAVSTYLIIVILHKQLKLPGKHHITLQLLSVHPFEKVTLNELLLETDHRTFINFDPNQWNLF